MVYNKLFNTEKYTYVGEGTTSLFEQRMKHEKTCVKNRRKRKNNGR